LGYLGIWVGFGLVAYGAAVGTGAVARQLPAAAPWVAAALLAAAGVYQLTPLKDWCLRQCQSPLGLLIKYASYSGRLRDLRVGVAHGSFCLGCCWGLMLVLLAVGVMNLGWMVALAALIFVEKTWRYGRWVGIAGGLVLIGLALLVPSHPDLAPGLHTAPMASGM
jgi:predicted metal-binding membrane protein